MSTKQNNQKSYCYCILTTDNIYCRITPHIEQTTYHNPQFEYPSLLYGQEQPNNHP